MGGGAVMRRGCLMAAGGVVVMAFAQLAFAHGSGAPVGDARFDRTAALATSQAALGHKLGDYRFVDDGGETVLLEQFRGRPLVISLIYTSCSHTCPILTSHLAQIVKIAREALGAHSFAVLTIGFDTPADTPERMRAFARERGIDIRGWHFVSADAPTVAALTRDLGFLYYHSAGGYDHLTQTTVIDAQGRVYRQVYGEAFPAPALVEPLKQLVFGTRAQASGFSGWINGVRLFCTVYDPASGRYRFDYSLLITIATGVVSLGAVAVFLIRAWRQSRSSTSAI
jgi:protein SCO1/2